MSTVTPAIRPRPPQRSLPPYPVAALDQILRRGLMSIREERFKRKEFCRKLGISVHTLVNIEHSRRNLHAVELLVFAFALNKPPAWVVQEILRRFEPEIAQWRKEARL